MKYQNISISHGPHFTVCPVISRQICHGPHLTVRPLTTPFSSTENKAIHYITFSFTYANIIIIHIDIEILGKYIALPSQITCNAHLACNALSPLAHNTNLVPTSNINILHKYNSQKYFTVFNKQ